MKAAFLVAACLQDACPRFPAKASIYVDAGVVKIEVPSDMSAEDMMKQLEEAGFTNLKIVQEVWTGNPVISGEYEPSFLTRLLNKLKGYVGLAEVDVTEATAEVFCMVAASIERSTR